MPDNPRLIQHRAKNAKAAIVFVHGFGGHADSTWGRFPGFLMAEGALERKRSDAEQALSLYRQALARAEAKPDAAQAYYHAINCAFMELAYGSDATACRAYAQRALTHCAQVPDTSGVVRRKPKRIFIWGARPSQPTRIAGRWP